MLQFLPIALSAGQGLLQGLGQKRQAKADAAALRQNAIYLNNAAWDARMRGRLESDYARLETQQGIGTQRAAQAASGGEVNTGTNAILQQDTAQFGELDALTIANNAAREAYGYEVEATGLQNQARALKKAASRAPIQGLLSGAVQGFGDAYASGRLGSLFGGTSSTARLGRGTRAAIRSTGGIDYNQAIG